MNATDTINILYMEKVALNAQKSRAMAHDAGLFPEGQWQWALRKLRDSRGNLLQGKAMADKKLEMGAVDNNSYQKLKSLHRTHGSGTYGPGTENEAFLNDSSIDESFQGTEIGAGILLDSKQRGKIVNQMVGPRGAGGIPEDHDAYKAIDENIHSLHTHPSAGALAFSLQAKRELAAVRGGKFDNWLGESTGDLLSAANKGYARSTGKQNPLLASPSGRLVRYRDGIDGSEDFYVTGDIGSSYDKAVETYNRSLDSIIAPDIDVEGIHKVKDTGKLRSIYFNRSPRKAR